MRNFTHTTRERAVRYGSQGPLHPAGNGACAVGVQPAARIAGLTPKSPAGALAKASVARSGSRPAADTARAGRECHRAPFRCRSGQGPP